LHAFRKRQLRSRFHTIDDALRRDQAVRAFLELFAKLRASRRIRIRGRQFAGTPAAGSANIRAVNRMISKDKKKV